MLNAYSIFNPHMFTLVINWILVDKQREYKHKELQDIGYLKRIDLDIPIYYLNLLVCIYIHGEKRNDSVLHCVYSVHWTNIKTNSIEVWRLMFPWINCFCLCLEWTFNWILWSTNPMKGEGSRWTEKERDKTIYDHKISKKSVMYIHNFFVYLWNRSQETFQRPVEKWGKVFNS